MNSPIDLASKLDGQTKTLSFRRQRTNLTFLTSHYFIIWYTRLTVDEVIRRVVATLANATVSTFATTRFMDLHASEAAARRGIRVRKRINITPDNTERVHSAKDTTQYQNHQEANEKGPFTKPTNHHLHALFLNERSCLRKR